MRMIIHEYIWVSLGLLRSSWVFLGLFVSFRESLGFFGSPLVPVGLHGTPSLQTQESRWVSFGLFESLWVSLGSLGLLGLFGSPLLSLDSLKTPYPILLCSPYRSLFTGLSSLNYLNHFLI